MLTVSRKIRPGFGRRESNGHQAQQEEAKDGGPNPEPSDPTSMGGSKPRAMRANAMQATPGTSGMPGGPGGAMRGTDQPGAGPSAMTTGSERLSPGQPGPAGGGPAGAGFAPPSRWSGAAPCLCTGGC